MKQPNFIQTGTRTILGTKWTIETKIEKDGRTSKPWLVTYGICNGISESTQRFRTKKEALSAANHEE